VHHHRCHCDSGSLWPLLFLAIILDQQQPTQPPKPSDGQGCAQGCGSCLGSLLMLALLIGGILWLVHSSQHPGPPATARATEALYSYTDAAPPTPPVPTIDVAPRAELIAMPAQQPTPIRVLRATLVRLPVRRAKLVKLR
jgi:hypothetical protein